MLNLAVNKTHNGCTPGLYITSELKLQQQPHYEYTHHQVIQLHSTREIKSPYAMYTDH